MADDLLGGYAAKRNFDRTPEPAPTAAAPSGRLRFVVHKHAARALHYDLRLELAGALKSWACPKGPSLDPAVKRLAVKVEDHPLAYGEFEGVIPEGNYGAGGVIIWDRGYLRHPQAVEGEESEKLLLKGLEKGDLKFVLEGEKLKGEFALVKIRKDENSWLLLKKKDVFAGGGDILAENRSVASGLTLEELMEGGAKVPTARRSVERLLHREALEELAEAPGAPMPARVRPMLATPAEKPFDDPEWIFEMKWDGYRAIAEVREGGVALYSRNLLPLDEKFPPIARALDELGEEALLDGEIVAVDAAGRPDFQLLQDYRKTGKGSLLYYVFDLLHLAGHDLTSLPLVKRKELLRKLLPSGSPVRFGDHVAGQGTLFYRVVEEKGLEGIVAKRALSTYRAGVRSRDWLKIRRTPLTQDGVIAGFTASRGPGRPFGALLLGAFEKGELVFIGHTGGGFTARSLEEVHGMLLPLVIEECPFASLPKTNAPVTWVRPELVCEVAFKGWTAEGYMRHPVFLRLREDKPADEAVRERAEEV